MNSTKIQSNQFTEHVLEFGRPHWPAEGKVWVRFSDNYNAHEWRYSDWAGMGVIKRLRPTFPAIAAAWRAANVGDVVTVPSGFHPRHGVRTQSWLRVR